MMCPSLVCCLIQSFSGIPHAERALGFGIQFPVFAAMSGLISDMISASMAQHSRTLVENRYHNGHPDLIVNGIYPNDSVKAGEEGVEVKSTRKRGGAVDTHSARPTE